MDKYYLTTAIDYVNGAPHIGHAYEKILTDIIARHYSQRTDNMFFLTGTDEHGIKIQKTAAAQGKTPKELCDENAQKFKDAWKVLGVDYNRFIRTTDEDHEKIVQKIFKKLVEKTIYDHFGKHSPNELGFENILQENCVSALLRYLYETQKNGVSRISSVKFYDEKAFMKLDLSARRNLELTETIREKNKYGSLLWSIDNTKTNMGARLLKSWPYFSRSNSTAFSFL